MSESTNEKDSRCFYCHYEEHLATEIQCPVIGWEKHALTQNSLRGMAPSRRRTEHTACNRASPTGSFTRGALNRHLFFLHRSSIFILKCGITGDRKRTPWIPSTPAISAQIHL